MLFKAAEEGYLARQQISRPTRPHSSPPPPDTACRPPRRSRASAATSASATCQCLCKDVWNTCAYRGLKEAVGACLPDAELGVVDADVGDRHLRVRGRFRWWFRFRFRYWFSQAVGVVDAGSWSSQRRRRRWRSSPAGQWWVQVMVEAGYVKVGLVRGLVSARAAGQYAVSSSGVLYFVGLGSDLVSVWAAECVLRRVLSAVL